MNIAELAQIVDQAAMNATATSQLSLAHSFTVDEAYAIQKASIDRRIERGEKLIGIKMGFTSEAKMKQMGVHDMIWGLLTDSMWLEEGEELNFDECIHPRAEPEICYRLAKELNREYKLDEVFDLVDGVASAIEVIDSRYENFKFSLEDVIADNCSSRALVVGEWQTPPADLNGLGMELKFDGEIVREGSSDAILDNPWRSLAAATRLAHQYGLTLPAGSIVMAGASTPAEFLKRGSVVSVNVDSLGSASFKVNA